MVANCSAVREWDSNGTLFGYRSGCKGFQAGEFGHNDFYPVVIAAAHVLYGSSRALDGRSDMSMTHDDLLYFLLLDPHTFHLMHCTV